MWKLITLSLFIFSLNERQGLVFSVLQKAILPRDFYKSILVLGRPSHASTLFPTPLLLIKIIFESLLYEKQQSIWFNLGDVEKHMENSPWMKETFFKNRECKSVERAQVLDSNNQRFSLSLVKPLSIIICKIEDWLYVPQKCWKSKWNYVYKNASFVGSHCASVRCCSRVE